VGSDTLRSLMLAILVLGVVGTASELLLLEHFDGWQQWIPLALFALAMAALGWYGVARGRAAIRMLQVVMGAFVLGGLAGVVLHYRGNAVFELEMEPALSGWPLFKAAMMGATPALAPGAMAQLGLLGLLWCWRHPALADTTETFSSTMDA
jgi:hypothetical protein